MINLATATDAELAEAMAKEDEAPATAESASKPATQPTSESTPQTETPTIESLQEKLQALEKRLRDKDSHIGKQRNELNEMKTQLEQAKRNLPPEPSDDEFHTNPKEAASKLRQHEDAKKELSIKEQQIQLQERIESHKAAVYTHVPEFDTHIPELEKLMVDEDKQDPQLVKNFLANPFFADPILLIQMARRAQGRTELNQYRAKVEELEKQIESLKKKPNRLLDNIEKSAKNGPTLTSKSGQSTSTKERAPVSEAQAAAMSYEELTKALSEADENE